MKQRGYLWLTLAGAVIIGVFMAIFVSAEKRSGIAYKGKPLEYWFSQTLITLVNTDGSCSRLVCLNMPDSRYGCYLEQPNDVKNAFQAMGTNCLPFIIKKLGAHDTRMSRAVERLKGLLRIKNRSPAKDLERGQAITALEWLDPLPSATHEQIRALSKNSNAAVAVSAKCVLQRCHRMNDSHPATK